MNLDGRRILVADDDPTIRRMLARALREWGYDVSLAADGTAALAELASDHPPALAILDLQMPGLTGPEVCRRVRDLSLASYSYLLLLTAHASPDAVIDALQDGFDDVLGKPLELRELRARLDAGVRGRQRVAPQAPQKTLYPVGMRSPIEGRVVAGKYRVEYLVGEGGMGTVWRGHRIADEAPVAIKFVRPKFVNDQTALARFRVEALVGTRLQSAHATRVLDFGVTPDKLPYLVMEYLEGESLLAHVTRRGPLSVKATATVVSQIAKALSAARALGIDHRDVKPENILLAAAAPGEGDDACDGDEDFPFCAKLIDFGIAKLRPRRDSSEHGLHDALGVPGASEPLTAHGCLVGTPHYMSPEQLLGHAEGDARADLWGLAASAFFAVTGDAPFEGATLGQIVMRVCSEPLPRMAARGGDDAHAFDTWFATACARDASLRYQTAEALAEALVTAATASRDTRGFAKSGTYALVERRADDMPARVRAR